MNVQAAFEHFRKESGLVGEEIQRLLAPKEDGSRSDEEDLRRRQELQALLTRQNEAASMLLALKGREMRRALAEEIAEQRGGVVGAASNGMSKDELASPQNSSDLFVAPAIFEEPKFPLPVVVDQHLITVESSKPGHEVKTLQEITVTGRPEKIEEGAPTVPIGDDPSIAPEIPRSPQERGLQKQRLDYDWSSLAARCTEAMLPASQLLKDLSETFNARFEISELGLSAEEAFSFMEQAFPNLDYDFRFKDVGWVVTLSNHECRNRDALALAIYGAVCLMLGRQRTVVEERAGDPDQTEKKI